MNYNKMQIEHNRNIYSNRRNSRNNAYYQKDSAARALDFDVVKAMEEEPLRVVKSDGYRNREKNMNLASVLILAAVLVLVSYVLISYINLRATVTATVNHISSMESELNGLKMTNDEEYNRIVSGINLDDVRQIAVEELGMVYAREGQVYTFSGEGNDYVRQTSNLHE